MTPLLRAVGLTKHFGGVAAVASVTLEVASGEIRALIGPNGSGKSTFINLLSGIYRPTAGHVTFMAQVISGFQPHTITRKGISRTFQAVRLFRDLTVFENVMVGCDWQSRGHIWDAALRTRHLHKEERQAKETARLACEKVGITALAGVPARNLSHGQQRRVEIARALVAGPKLLLLDEPVAGMNPAEVSELGKQLRAIRDDGIAILLIEHNMRFVMDLADRVTVFDHGEKIFEGTPGETRMDDRVIEAYLGRANGAARD